MPLREGTDLNNITQIASGRGKMQPHCKMSSVDHIEGAQFMVMVMLGTVVVVLVL